jgi:creatinine amidohydrolase
VSVEAAEPLAVPVFPVLSYGLTPNFVEYPGTVTLRLSTLCAVITDVLNGIARSGFKRIVIVNGHGGNSPAHGAVLEWLDTHCGCQVKWHNWWNAPKTMAKVQAIDPRASHASWMENFPWTRLGNIAMPAEAKPMMDQARFIQLDPVAKKALLGDGNYGGLYQRSDRDMAAVWEVAVAETRSLIADWWA